MIIGVPYFSKAYPSFKTSRLKFLKSRASWCHNCIKMSSDISPCEDIYGRALPNIWNKDPNTYLQLIWGYENLEKYVQWKIVIKTTWNLGKLSDWSLPRPCNTKDEMVKAHKSIKIDQDPKDTHIKELKIKMEVAKKTGWYSATDTHWPRQIKRFWNRQYIRL